MLHDLHFQNYVCFTSLNSGAHIKDFKIVCPLSNEGVSREKREGNHVCNIKVITDGTARVKEETATVVMVNVFMAMWSTQPCGVGRSITEIIAGWDSAAW